MNELGLPMMAFFVSLGWITVVSANSTFGPREELMIRAAAFEFDAVSARQCRLTQAERALAAGPDPELKVVLLDTALDRGQLLLRSPDLLNPIQTTRVGSIIGPVLSLRLIRNADCHMPPSAATATPTEPASAADPKPIVLVGRQ